MFVTSDMTSAVALLRTIIPTKRENVRKQMNNFFTELIVVGVKKTWWISIIIALIVHIWFVEFFFL